MSIELLPDFIREHYECHEWHHACAIMHTDFPQEWAEMIDVLTRFRLKKSFIDVGGGNKSKVSSWIDGELAKRGWEEKNFDTKIVIDKTELESPTHAVDCYKNRIALEIEWNNKDPFYDRDLNNFRLLHQLRTVSVGVIITRTDALRSLFKDIGRNNTSFGASTTHMSKLLPRVLGGGSGGCPLLVFGITKKLYEDS